MMRVAASRSAARLLSTAPKLPTPTGAGNSGSNGLVSRALIVAAVAAPVGFGVYKWQNDEAFKKSILDVFSGKGVPAIPKKQPVPDLPSLPAPLEPETAVVVVEEEKYESPIDPHELDDLERRLQPSFHVTFEREEVKDVEKRIAEAEKAAAEKAEAESEEEEAKNNAERVGQVDLSPTPDEEKLKKELEEKSERQALEAVRNVAKQIGQQAEEAAKAEIAKAQSALRADIEKVLAKDLGSLDTEGLRERVVQLTLELKDRNRWEAARLHEVITKTVEDLSQKYLNIMKEQEAGYESVVRSEVAHAAMESAALTEERLSKSLQDRLNRQREALRAEMELTVERAREQERQISDRERMERMTMLHELEKKLLELDEALWEKDKARAELARSKRATVAVLRFCRATLLEKSSPEQVEHVLSELRLASANDPVVTEALDALPHRVFASGVASVHRLSKVFESEVKSDVIQTSMIPENASLVQQALARATTALLIPGTAASPDSGDNSVESICLRVQHYLDREDLVSAVKQMESLPTNVLEKSLGAKDWLAQARDRLKVEATVRLLTARFEESDTL